MNIHQIQEANSQCSLQICRIIHDVDSNGKGFRTCDNIDIKKMRFNTWQKWFENNKNKFDNMPTLRSCIVKTKHRTHNNFGIILKSIS